MHSKGPSGVDWRKSVNNIIHFKLACNSQNAGRFDEAIKHYKIVLSENPGRVDAIVSLSRIFCLKDELNRARTTLESAITKNPLEAELLFPTGHCSIPATRTKASSPGPCLTV